MELLSPSKINARVKVLEKPVAHPGKCVVCGAVNTSVVDIGLDVDNYGVIYFCVTCLAEIGRAIHLVPTAELMDNSRETESIVKDYCDRTNQVLVNVDTVRVIGSSVFALANCVDEFGPLVDLSAVSGRSKEESESPQDHPQDALFDLSRTTKHYEPFSF